MDPDIHWSAMSGHVSTFIVNGGRYDNIFWTEKFNDGMQSVLDSIETKNSVVLGDVPRFNESEGHGPKRAHPIEDYFDDLSMHLVYEIYKRDFRSSNMTLKTPQTKCRLARSTSMRSMLNSAIKVFAGSGHRGPSHKASPRVRIF